MAQTVKNLPAMRRPGSNPWVGKIPGEGHGLPAGFPWIEEPGGLQSMG